MEYENISNFSGQTLKGNIVFGLLTILNKKYDGNEPGYYISNKAGYPFAYAVRPDSVVNLATYVTEQENIQLKSELQGIRERLKGIEYDDCDRCSYCSRHKENPHADYCWLKIELDKLEVK